MQKSLKRNLTEDSDYLYDDEEELLQAFHGIGPLLGINSLSQLLDVYGSLTLEDFFTAICELDHIIQEDYINYDSELEGELNYLIEEIDLTPLKNFLMDQGLLEYA